MENKVVNCNEAGIGIGRLMPCFQGKTIPLSEPVQYNLALFGLTPFNSLTEDFTEVFLLLTHHATPFQRFSLFATRVRTTICSFDAPASERSGRCWTGHYCGEAANIIYNSNVVLLPL
jgi:hypothetical protein